MSTRSVIVRLEAEVSQFVAGMGRASQATDTVAGNIVRTRRNVADNSAAMEKAGGIMLKAGAATVGALGAMTKASMDWETAWTGVKKTVDGTPQQLKGVEDGLRGLAKSLPGTHTEIAAVAEAAGQLGIQTPNVVAFTKTMIDLGESTNLSAEDAATGLARFSNVMGTSQSDVGKLGAALVGLGNNYATTEAEILSMGMRLAGVGQQVGLSEGQVLGLGAAMSSVGIEAEAGGTAMSTVMKKISAAVDEGGEDMAEYARISGMTTEQFSKAWKEDAGGALVAFTEGLGKAGEAGESVNTMLGDLGIKGIRETDTLLRLSAAGGLMGEALTSGVQEYTAGTALIEEANKRYETSASKVAISWNKIKDASIDAGSVLLPIMSGIMESVAGLSSAFGDLPAPVQSTLVIMAGLGGALLLVGGGLLTMIPKVAAARVAFATLNTSGGRMVGTMKTLGKAVGVAGAALIAFEIFNAVAYEKRIFSIEQVTSAINGVSDASKGIKSLDEMFGDYGTFAGKEIAADLNGIGDAIKRITNPEGNDGINRWADQAFGWTGFAKSQTTQVDDRLKELGDTMGQMVGSGNAEAAATAFRELSKEFEANGSNAADALARLPGYENALLGLANQAGTATDKQSILNMAMGDSKNPVETAAAAQAVLQGSLDETGVSLGGVIEDMKKFLELLFQTGMLTMSARDANVAYHEALRGIDEALKTVNGSAGAMGAMLNENATDFDLSTEAGAAANNAFQTLARGGMTEVEALSKSGAGQDELQAKLTQTHADLITAADTFGITGTAADELARKVLGVPDGVSIETWIDDIASTKTAALEKQLNDINGKTVDTYINTHYKSIVSEERIANAPGGSGGLQRSAGGPIIGPGTGTSDDVPIWGSNGEHMLTTQDVLAMGGQDAVYRFRAGLHSDKAGDGSLKLAGGGAVSPSRGTMVDSRQLVSSGSGGTVVQYLINQQFEATNARAEGIIREMGAESAHQLTRVIGRNNLGR